MNVVRYVRLPLQKSMIDDVSSSTSEYLDFLCTSLRDSINF